MKTKWHVLFLATVMLCLASVASADKIDWFDGIIEAGNLVYSGAGPNTGWNGDGLGPWYEYPQTEPETSWWNQWFYDDPPMPSPWYKEISWGIDIFPSAPSFLEIAINWSTLDFGPTGPDGPPPMPQDEPYIMREIIFYTAVSGHVYIESSYVIPDYNPEWVSIDIRADIPVGTVVNTVQVTGWIEHDCIPEPATLGLLLLGGLALLRRKRST